MGDKTEHNYITFYLHNDGFGSQYQHIIATMLYCFNNGYQFVYNPIKYIEHNYNKDSNYVSKMEKLMNINSLYPSIYDEKFNGKEIGTFVDAKSSLDLNIEYYTTPQCMLPIRQLFWANKDKSSVFGNNGKINVAIHIRRMNEYDKTLERAHEEIFRFNSRDSYYMSIIERIRKEHGGKEKELLFHIYSQGNIIDFTCFIAKDTVLHIDEDLYDTFTQMVAADIIMTSFSSLSYVAALLNEGIVYFHPFWHKPKKEWIII
jgi:hypothetical protein